MPSTVAVLSGLTYKGTDLQDFPRIFLQVTEGGPGTSPEVRGQNRTTPYKRGQTYAPRRADRLVIALTGWIAGAGATEADQRDDTATARMALFALFDVEGGVGNLVVVDEAGTTWTASCYPEVFLPEMDPAIPTHQGISIRLVCVDPPNWVSS